MQAVFVFGHRFECAIAARSRCERDRDQPAAPEQVRVIGIGRDAGGAVRIDHAPRPVTLGEESMIDEGRLLRVRDLPTLITVKTKAGRPKDRLVLPILIATLQERDEAKE